jgi:hypothetical protein
LVFGLKFWPHFQNLGDFPFNILVTMLMNLL